jgi:hypothetical protein
MNIEYTAIHARGKTIRVPSVRIDGSIVVATGNWLKLASLHEEESLEQEAVTDPDNFISSLKQSKLPADIFAFSQRLPDITPKYDYFYQWDNAAAIPILNYEDWYKNRAADSAKRKVKRAAKAGVVTKSVPFDDMLVTGIVGIYNESPLRQGRPFWHYGKDFSVVKVETAHCLERSEFIGAYLNDELIGFIKLIYAGQTARIVLIISKQMHFDKSPTNALIAKAVEICAQKKIPYLTYEKYSYGSKTHSSLADFKRHNGFEEIRFPRYYIPLTLKGRIAVKLNLHRGLKVMLPANVLTKLLDLRSKLYNSFQKPRVSPKS